MISTNSRWRADIEPGERSSNSTNPLIDVSGLRSSCDAVATNSLLARSSRARSVVSRIVHTIPPELDPSWSGVSAAAMIASVRSRCSTIASPLRACWTSGSGVSAASIRPPGASSGTSSRARRLTALIVAWSASVTIRPSPRLSMITASRRRSRSSRRCASTTVKGMSAQGSERAIGRFRTVRERIAARAARTNGPPSRALPGGLHPLFTTVEGSVHRGRSKVFVGQPGRSSRAQVDADGARTDRGRAGCRLRFE